MIGHCGGLRGCCHGCGSDVGGVAVVRCYGAVFVVSASPTHSIQGVTTAAGSFHALLPAIPPVGVVKPPSVTGM